MACKLWNLKGPVFQLLLCSQNLQPPLLMSWTEEVVVSFCCSALPRINWRGQSRSRVRETARLGLARQFYSPRARFNMAISEDTMLKFESRSPRCATILDDTQVIITITQITTMATEQRKTHTVPRVLRILIPLACFMLLRSSPAICSYTILEDARNPPSTARRALNARLSPFQGMPKDVEAALGLILNQRNRTRATFVQIGANDGQMFDELYPHTKRNKSRWIGLQVEPQPNLYSALAVLHADAPDWAFYHGALATQAVCQNGTVPFCETKTPGKGDWLTQGQLNSVDLIKCYLETMQMRLRPCVTSFDDLIGKHASPVFLQHALVDESATSSKEYLVDFLMIDVEGKDYDVLQLIDWDIMYPQCIHYEYKHLKENATKAKDLMHEKGYTVVETSMDVLACLVEDTNKTKS